MIDPDSVLCASCGGGLERADAFKHGPDYFHPKCAEVWACPNCGAWNEKDIDECECGEKRP